MLSELIPGATLPVDVEIGGLTLDSRKVAPGDLFFAFPGARHDGRQFIKDAIERRAAAVVYEINGGENDYNVPCIGLRDVSSELGKIAARYFDHPSDHMLVVAVTGTNGKTSTTHFIAEALGALGRKCGLIGTLGTGLPGRLESTGLTTPDAIGVQEAMARLVGEEAAAVAVEASSHGLAQGRLNGTSIDIAVFTNLTRDHLDYHDTFEGYQRAKQQLFEWRGLQGGVLNVDDEFGVKLADSIDRSVRTLTYSRKDSGADIHCANTAFVDDGIEADLVTPWGTGRIFTSLFGEFNLSNILAVAGVLGLMGHDFPDIVSAIKGLRTVRGRMDVISREGFATVVIDYAHTPDALQKAIEAVRKHCKGRLWCVFGCGGDRDTGKRPLMGKVAVELADRVIITDDNPRTEPSLDIVNDILQGIPDCRNVEVETDRANAISLALSGAGEDDMVLLAGKGHEEYQELNGKRVDFSDYAEVEGFFAGNER